MLCIGDIALIIKYLSANKDVSGDYEGPERSIVTQTGLSRDENGDFQLLSGSFDEKVNSEEDARAS